MLMMTKESYFRRERKREMRGRRDRQKIELYNEREEERDER
jgi:hypothetical protein